MLAAREQTAIDTDLLWYKDAIIYEVHVRAFHDSQGDGMGDFAGLTQKLGYLQDLGVTALWVLPFFPSPWKDDGYDIADYFTVHPAYGTLDDFKAFLDEAHKRGIRVITEVVINHTSDQHPWFQRSRRAAPGDPWRDYYVWSDTPEKYKDARIIFKDFETSNWTWDPVAKAYYWHRFYSHQPDLNFDNPAVRKAVFEVIDYWFDMGVDAFRLDAIPYLFERENTNCENLPETHAFLKELRAHVDSKYRGKMLLAEANQWPEDAIAYFGNGDECNMAFHFPVMPRLFMANRMEDRYPIVEILKHTPPIPESAQWAMFLRNHDELTLEMVTDEERDYMYRAYATDRQMRINLGIRRRLAPLLGNDRRKIELMNALLFSLPGSPVIYYGDEIGMGDNIFLGDRNGVRTPMQWSADRNAGFSSASPQKLYLPITFDPEYHYETVNVQAQQNNANSLLWWMKRLISTRKAHRAFGRGSLEFLNPANRKVLAFYRRYEDENLLVIANLSRFPQHVDLDLSQFKGFVPVEMFGGTPFPTIADIPYTVTLGGYDFFWFSLEKLHGRQESLMPVHDLSSAPLLQISGPHDLLSPRSIGSLTRLLPRFLETRRWYRGRGRRIRDIDVVDVVKITANTYVVFVRVEYPEAESDFYLLPLAVAWNDEVATVAAEHPDTAFARLHSTDGTDGVVYSALLNRDFGFALLNGIAQSGRFLGSNGYLSASHTANAAIDSKATTPSASQAEQTNSALVFGNQYILKLFRHVEPGVNPALEMSGFLADQGFTHTPKLLGHIEYRSHEGDSMISAALHEFIPNQGNAWAYTADALSRFYQLALARSDWHAMTSIASGHPLNVAEQTPPEAVVELMQDYLNSARILGVRTAEMHRALLNGDSNADFKPEPFADDYRQGLQYGMLGTANRTLELLSRRKDKLNPPGPDLANELLRRSEIINYRLRALRDVRIHAVRIRIHGDLSLREFLYTGNDFYVIDFESDANRPLSERRLKRSALKDVASMLRSFEFAAYGVFHGRIAGVTPSPEQIPILEWAAALWTTWASAMYLKGYLSTGSALPFVPGTKEQTRVLLDAYRLDEIMQDVAYELNFLPDSVPVSLRELLRLMAE